LSISVILWALSGIAIFAVGLGLLSYSVFHNQDASPYPLIARFSSWLVICFLVWIILIGVFDWHLFGISIPRHANRDFIPHGLVRVLPDGRENIDWSLVLFLISMSSYLVLGALTLFFTIARLRRQGRLSNASRHTRDQLIIQKLSDLDCRGIVLRFGAIPRSGPRATPILVEIRT